MRHFKFIHLDSSKAHSPSAVRSRSVRRTDPAPERPTRRELQVEYMLCRGYSQENIAATLGVSVKTISAHAMSLYRKRGVHTKVGLLLAYLKRRGIFVFRDEEPAHNSNALVSLEVAQ